MSFFNSPQQAQLMAQMFQNPQGGGMAAPQPGQGGAQTGMGIGPSFSGPEGAPGVQTLPFQGPMPDFTMGTFQPGSPTGIQDLGSSQGMPAPGIEQLPYQEPDGFGQAFSRNFKMPEASANAPQGGGRIPTPRQKPAMGAQGMDPNIGAGQGNMGVAHGPKGPVSASSDPEEERKRQVLIQAIMKRAFGG